jgi:hypothetical protein
MKQLTWHRHGHDRRRRRRPTHRIDPEVLAELVIIADRRAPVVNP